MGASSVVINVYDLCDWNYWLYCCGCGGIFHTGVEVHGIEYAYGGHEYDISGIFATNPRDAPGPVVWRESVVVGDTHMGPQEVQDLVQSLGNKYKGRSYHLLQRNCNHFSEELVWRLCRQRLPSWINRLAGLAVFLHCLLPASWVPPLKTPSSTMVSGGQHQEDEQANLLANGFQQPSFDRSPSVSA
ncbi:hypothetical protein WJX73_003507 [Symbiochloris irregularis]|uniref:PPPDE domain-containing protein n=1 Tax=Symbiochloris irregularis TaxID=706552 RepID=A0AAW1NJ01_9CHLO